MIKRKIMTATMVVSLLAATAPVLQAQTDTDPVVIEVGGQQIRQSEFMQEFLSNVGNQLAKKHDITNDEKRAALGEYVELYATFRAKLLDAHERGFDTSQSMLDELARYRSELAAPYLLDSSVLRHLLAEAYDRNHYSLHAAHILVPVPAGAAPDDTLAAYNKINELYRRITVGGEDFFAVSAEYFGSRNPGVQARPNEGDLGYFTVFDMVYPFENAAYALKVGEVSKPVRTRYGYHIIKLIDRVEGLYGKVTMAHIWLHSTDSNVRRADINMMYNELMGGRPFEQVARQSDDRTTSSKGGVLADASLTQLPPEYIHQLIGMKEGDISRPFFTQYGWHIIKLIKRDTLPRPENLEGFYKQRMTRDQRGDESRKTFAADSRRKYGIVDCTTTPVEQPKAKKGSRKQPKVKMMASLDELVGAMPDSVFHGKWKLADNDLANASTLIITPAQRFTSRDVAHYIVAHQQNGRKEDKYVYARRFFDQFLDSVSIAYADSQLEKDYPEFAKIVEEYRRGLIIFNYNDAMIWRKAMEDTVGFVDFYDRESRTKSLDKPEDSIYFFHTRARVSLIDVSDSKALNPTKAQKLITKAQKKNMGSREMQQMLLGKIDHKKYGGDDMVKVDVELVEKTRQQLLQDNQWQRGVYLQENGPTYRLIVVDDIIPPTLKGHKEARGYYLNAWQNEVERELNADLRKKYNVKVHHNVVRTIAY